MSLLDHQTWLKLPHLAKVGVLSARVEGAQLQILGVTGKTNGAGVVNLRVEIAGTTSLQQFWLMRDLKNNILGMPWLLDTGAVINCRNQSLELNGTQIPLKGDPEDGENPIIHTASRSG